MPFLDAAWSPDPHGAVGTDVGVLIDRTPSPIAAGCHQKHKCEAQASRHQGFHTFYSGFEEENCNPSHRKMILSDLNSPGGCNQKQVLRACGAQDDMPRDFFREKKEERWIISAVLLAEKVGITTGSVTNQLITNCYVSSELFSAPSSSTRQKADLEAAPIRIGAHVRRGPPHAARAPKDNSGAAAES